MSRRWWSGGYAVLSLEKYLRCFYQASCLRNYFAVLNDPLVEYAVKRLRDDLPMLVDGTN